MEVHEGKEIMCSNKGRTGGRIGWQYSLSGIDEVNSANGDGTRKIRMEWRRRQRKNISQWKKSEQVSVTLS